MSDAEHWVNRDELIAYAAELGANISRYQLERWHKNGLLPRPRRRALGRGKGMASQYPLSAVHQAIFLAAARRHYRNLDTLAWMAWVNGYPVTPRIRRMLGRKLARQRDAIVSGLEAFENEVADNPIDRAVDRPMPKGMRRLRRDLRATFQRVLMELQVGEFDVDRYGFAELNEIFRLVPRRRSRTASGADAEVLQPLFECMAAAMSLEHQQDVVEKMSDERLERRLEDTRRVWRVAERLANGKLPFTHVTYGAFSMVMLVTHASPHARWARRWLAREVRAHGFATIEEAIVTMHERREAERTSE